MKNIEKFEKFIISQKGLLIRNNKALIMEMAIHPGYWDLPGGRVDVQENGEGAFAREIVEELGIKEFRNLGVAHYHLWHDGKDKIAVCGILNLIENNKDDIVISSEHLKMKWIDEFEIDECDYFWDEMHTMIKKGFEKYKLLK
jgi:8-oxo-dGTP pyrophosphatase MutT (NUDIX family)